jgi:uncharacterized protein YbjT (DUF2867 family)
MTVIAVAGGTGSVGKTFVERLCQESNVHVIVLSRTVSLVSRGKLPAITDPSASTKASGPQDNVQLVQIDYNDIPAMTAELERHNVHTIISAIGLVSNETSQSQLNLIEAAEKSSPTKRFIPSEYSFIQTPE